MFGKLNTIIEESHFLDIWGSEFYFSLPTYAYQLPPPFLNNDSDQTLDIPL